MSQIIGQNKGGVRKPPSQMNDVVPLDEEEVEGQEAAGQEQPNGHEMLDYQRLVTQDRLNTLIQRISVSLQANTPLVMCVNDIDALSFALTALDCVDLDTLLDMVNQPQEEEPEG